jgi:hypothetical protein
MGEVAVKLVGKKLAPRRLSAGDRVYNVASVEVKAVVVKFLYALWSGEDWQLSLPSVVIKYTHVPDWLFPAGGAFMLDRETLTLESEWVKL